MNLASGVERLVGRLRGEPSYHFAEGLSRRQLLGVLVVRYRQLSRGCWRRLWVGRCEGILFVGRRVVIEFGHQVRLGRQVILEDGVYLNALSKRGIAIGRNVTIGRGAAIVCSGVVRRLGEGITVGEYSAVGSHSFLAAQGGIDIGRNVIMGPGVRIFSEDHCFERDDVPIRLQGERRARVVIQDDCWIGAGVIILKGVNIGSGSVVAAGTVVVGDLPSNSFAAGVPARVIRHRISR